MSGLGRLFKTYPFARYTDRRIAWFVFILIPLARAIAPRLAELCDKEKVLH